MDRKSLILLAVCNMFLTVNAATPVSNCLSSTSAKNILTALPGTGWDNLVNENRGTILKHTYSKCQTTDDGVYLVPDDVFVVPQRSSNVDIFSEIFDNWSNYTSTTSQSINADGSYKKPKVFSIHGTYSSEYKQVKSEQVSDNSMTVRVGARYEMYIVRLQNDMSLDETFRDRVSVIAEHLVFDRRHSARYESQLLIRDYGTHLVTEISEGAAIYKLDQLSRTSVQTSDLSRSDIASSAGLSLYKLKIGYKEDSSSSDEKLTAYLGVRTHSSIKSHGGPLFKPLNFSINDWVDSVDKNIVPIDRSGDPLHLVVNINNFPELPETIVHQTSLSIEEAIDSYYKFNTIKGCTDMNSPNFNFLANVEDGTCEDPGTNLTFGGVYQTCSQEVFFTENYCDDLVTINPKTGAPTCPEGYESVKLFEGSLTKTEYTKECESYFLFFHKCDEELQLIPVTYQTFWCAAVKNNAPDDSGYLFGGLFTPNLPNLLTNGPVCPQSFKSIRIATDISVCLSDDFETGGKYSVPLGGFFSCQQGNPLANKYYTPDSIPKTCPTGYSQHIADIEDGCEISYCTKIKNTVTKIRIRSPPFVRPRLEKAENSSYIVDIEGTSWTNIFPVPDNFSGFSGVVPGWITNDGNKLDFAEIMMERQQNLDKTNPHLPKTSEALGEANNNPDNNNSVTTGHKRLSTFEIIMLSAVSALTTTVCVIIVVAIVRRAKTNRGEKLE